MESGFLFPSENLNYLIGFFLLYERNIIIVSPWITDFDIVFPINSANLTEMPLSVAINTFSNTRNISLILSTEEEKFTQRFLSKITNEKTKIRKVENLHAKLILTDNFVYLGSANITKAGTSINVEICKLERNPFKSAIKYLKENLKLEI
jgi:hypothetical protein